MDCYPELILQDYGIGTTSRTHIVLEVGLAMYSALLIARYFGKALSKLR